MNDIRFVQLSPEDIQKLKEDIEKLKKRKVELGTILNEAEQAYRFKTLKLNQTLHVYDNVYKKTIQKLEKEREKEENLYSRAKWIPLIRDLDDEIGKITVGKQVDAEQLIRDVLAFQNMVCKKYLNENRDTERKALDNYRERFAGVITDVSPKRGIILAGNHITIKKYEIVPQNQSLLRYCNIVNASEHWNGDDLAFMQVIWIWKHSTHSSPFVSAGHRPKRCGWFDTHSQVAFSNHKLMYQIPPKPYKEGAIRNFIKQEPCEIRNILNGTAVSILGLSQVGW